MSHTIEVKVRFAETDAVGHVNNTSYFIYLEQARIEFLESIGAATNINEWRYVVAHVSCDFLKQSYFNEQLSIVTTVSHVGNKSFHLHHAIVRQSNGELVANGKAVLIYYNFDTQKSEQVPDKIKEKLMSSLEIIADK